MTCQTQRQHVCTKNKRLITDKKEGTVERPLLRILMLNIMTRTATSGISFHVFKNDRNVIVHSLRAKGTTAYEMSNSDIFSMLFGPDSNGSKLSKVVHTSRTDWIGNAANVLWVFYGVSSQLRCSENFLEVKSFELLLDKSKENKVESIQKAIFMETAP